MTGAAVYVDALAEHLAMPSDASDRDLLAQIRGQRHPAMDGGEASTPGSRAAQPGTPDGLGNVRHWDEIG
jgi:hypothetical protein